MLLYCNANWSPVTVGPGMPALIGRATWRYRFYKLIINSAKSVSWTKWRHRFCILITSVARVLAEQSDVISGIPLNSIGGLSLLLYVLSVGFMVRRGHTGQVFILHKKFWASLFSCTKISDPPLFPPAPSPVINDRSLRVTWPLFHWASSWRN